MPFVDCSLTIVSAQSLAISPLTIFSGEYSNDISGDITLNNNGSTELPFGIKGVYTAANNATIKFTTTQAIPAGGGIQTPVTLDGVFDEAATATVQFDVSF